MANIVPFEGGALPSYIKNLPADTLNDDLTAHAGAGFPVISIKGKVFAFVRDGDRKIVANPKDPESPATNLDVVLVKANKATSKVFYLNGYTEGAEATKPDCFSSDGTVPDPSAESPQSKSCATCKHNVWGSKVGDGGTASKGKACQDSVRLAVSTLDALKDPYLLRVPPASIRALGEYGKLLKTRGVKYNMVITKISFDMEAPTPKLMFKPVGFLPEDVYTKVTQLADTEVVQNILGNIGVATEEAEPAAAPKSEKKVSQEEAAAAVAKATVEKAAKPAAPKPAPADPELEISLDDLKFDD